MSTKASLIYIHETEDHSDMHIYEEMTDGYVWLEMSGRDTNLSVRLCTLKEWQQAFKKKTL